MVSSVEQNATVHFPINTSNSVSKKDNLYYNAVFYRRHVHALYILYTGNYIIE